MVYHLHKNGICAAVTNCRFKGCWASSGELIKLTYTDIIPLFEKEKKVVVGRASNNIIEEIAFDDSSSDSFTLFDNYMNHRIVCFSELMAALDLEGTVYRWGPKNTIKWDTPEKCVSIGRNFNYGVALGVSGKLYNWNDIDTDIKKKIKKNRYKAISEDGEILVDIKGDIYSISNNDYEPILLGKDCVSVTGKDGFSSIFALDSKGSIHRLDTYLSTFSKLRFNKKVKYIRVYSEQCMLIDENGKAHIYWDSNDGEVAPQKINVNDDSNFIKIVYVDNYFFLLNDKGKVTRIKGNRHGSVYPPEVYNVPSFGDRIIDIESGSYYMVAMGESGKIYFWGNREDNVYQESLFKKRAKSADMVYLEKNLPDVFKPFE